MLESRELERAVTAVRERIAAAAARAGRDPASVRLIAVTKEVRAEAVRAAAGAGIGEFGENYVQELERKRDAAPDAVWHFIGRVQRNKAARVARLADVVQALEPGRAADRLAETAAQLGRALDCLVEVDFAGGRVGVPPEDAPSFVDRLAEVPALRVVGLMTVAPFGEPPRPYFAALRDVRDRIRTTHEDVTELSMGMSSDYEDAVEEGATMVRIGTAIFGPRA